MQVHRNIVDIHPDTTGTQCLKQFPSPDTRFILIYTNHIQMICMTNIHPYRKGFNPFNFGKGFVVLSGNLLPPRQPARQLLQLAHAEGTLKIGYTIIISQIHHLIKPWSLRLPLPVVIGNPVVAEDSHAFGVFFIVGGDHAPLTSGDVLHRMKAEDTQIRQ